MSGRILVVERHLVETAELVTRGATRGHEVVDVGVRGIERPVLGTNEPERADRVAGRFELDVRQRFRVRDLDPVPFDRAARERELAVHAGCIRHEREHRAVVEAVPAHRAGAARAHLRADVHVKLIVRRSRAVFHTDEHGARAGLGLGDRVLPWEPAELRQGVELVVEDCDAETAAAVEGAGAARLLTREVDRTIEARVAIRERAGAEPREGGGRIGHVRRRAHQRILVPDAGVGEIAFHHTALRVENVFRDESPAQQGRAHDGFGGRRVAELVVDVEDRLAVRASGTHAVGDTDELVALLRVAGPRNAVADAQQRLKSVLRRDGDDVRLDRRYEPGKRAQSLLAGRLTVNGRGSVRARAAGERERLPDTRYGRG